MRRFIITGAPGSGKPAIIRHLELDGFSVVEEAATDVIAAAQARGTAEPWAVASFIDAVAAKGCVGSLSWLPHLRIPDERTGAHQRGGNL